MAFVLFVKTAPEHGLDLEYLRRSSSAAGGFDLQRAVEELEERFVTTDAVEIGSILDGCSERLPKTVFRDAARFRREADLYSWVRLQNINQGVAPAPKLVMLHRRASDGESGCCTTGMGLATVFTAGERKWLQRFRKRWNVSLGKVPAGEVVPLAVLQEKAIILVHKGDQRVTFPPSRETACLPKGGSI